MILDFVGWTLNDRAAELSPAEFSIREMRILVIEYKGGHLIGSKDAEEKQNIGQLWAEKSGGKGLFLMAEKRDAQGRDTRAQILALAGH